MDILVTAFTPFGDFAENMSELVLRLLPDEGFDKLLLPTSYKRSAEILARRLAAYSHGAIILMGQASRDKITVERVAINVADCSLPDNDGVALTDVPVEEGGPAACFSTLPLKRIIAGADCRISNTAGTYVCNCLMYKALRMAGGLPCGFVHLPQSGDPEILAREIVKIANIVRCDNLSY